MTRLLLTTLYMYALLVSSVWAFEDQKGVTLHEAAGATGNGTAVDVSRYTTIGLDVVLASGSGTVTFEGRTDPAASYTSIQCTNRASGTASTTATATGNFQCSTAGLSDVRARISACSSCSFSVYGRVTTATSRSGGGSGSTLTIAEEDGSPSGSFTSAKFPNGTVTDNGDGTVSVAATGSPADATYITQTPNGSLSAEQALSALATGILKNTTTTGVLSIAAAGTDYVAPAGNVATATALAANGSNCAAGQAPLGVDASGAVETCTDYQEEPASNGLVAKTAANTSAARTITGTANEITVTNGDGVSGNPTLSLPSSIDLGGKTLEIPNSTTLPATCGVGQIYMDTDATSGQRLYLCQASNTWALQGDGGGGGSSSTGSSGAVQTADGAGAFTDSGCTATGGAMTCSGGFTSGGAGVGVVTMKEGAAPGAGTNAGEHNLYFDSADSGLKSHENGGSVVVYGTASNTQTLTNKTYDTEGTGNVFTTVRRVYFPAAGCINTTAGSVWDLPTSNPAVAACKTGTNTQMGTLDFADGSNLSAQVTYMLPTTWTGNIDARIKWLTSATSGDVVWQLSTICVADAETDDPAFNTASTVTDTAKGTTLQTNDAAITAVTVTGCAAGELMHIKIQRDSGHASDNLAATARLIGVELAVREAL